MSRLPLYVKIGDEYKEVDSIIVNQFAKPITKHLISDAVKKYLDVCTANKCVKNQKNELMFFGTFIKSLDVENVGDINSYHIEKHVNDLLKRIKPSSVVRRLSVIKNFFNKCIDWGLLNENPMSKIKTLKIEKNHFKPWSDIEYKNFLSLCDGDFKNLIEFLYFTGARPSEALNLKWSDIDYGQMTVTLKCNKNANISRSFPLSRDLDLIFHRINFKSDFVFKVNGKIINGNNLYQYTKHRLNILGYKKLTIYGLRHSFASRHCNSGLNAFQIQQLLGHSNIKMTLNYVKIEKKDLLQALNGANQ